MSAGGERQCGLGSLLPMSCRGRAEAFARRLHTRLRRLGSEPRPGEDSWLTAQPSQRRHLSDSDVFFDFDVDIGSPSSPVEEIPEIQLPNCKPPSADPESGCVFSSPADQDSPHSNSDSDATYYDLETDASDPAATKVYPKYQRLYDESQGTKPIVNINKLKISASDIRDQLLNCKPNTPDRQSPIKTQPLARENGFADYGSLNRAESQNSLFSPIRFDDCQKRSPSIERDQDQTSLGSTTADTSSFDGRSSSEDMGKDEVDFREATSGTSDASTLSESLHQIKLEIEGEAANENKGGDCTVKKLHVMIFKQGSPELNNVNDEEDPESKATLSEAIEEATECPLSEETDETTQPEEESAKVTEGEAEADDDRPQRVRRCSSLRTGKTPPGTPGRKKIVRFADVLGLDLADVKTFMDDIPYIPKSAYEDLRDADLNQWCQDSFVPAPPAPRVLKDKRLVIMFASPGDQANFLDILNARSVCLENAIIQDTGTVAISGTVRVRNLDFHKSVQIRYSLDSWKTFSDLQASYVPNSCDGFCDRFQFLLYAHTLTIGQRLEFAVRFMCKGCQFWDNNSGINYVVQCVACGPQDNFYQSSFINSVDSNSWHPSFY